ncbi:TetR/AcrR family transcriptional regulator [Rhodococcus sp. ARC_M6]|uniref:TetR/AcrR family transcriptional regulator n=1 Tax=Rhodococcus sp. ARC_M6 TaxID=2928852 RepID=UPI001FB47635|nr:TetR/AcrR family transcriptional regulator [Rhodococcus sp. ARC_M6]MCJ0907324.1 TetR/AcrR family transcriptional regulator [Rhodococcus sp. ARC_M6]
MRDLIDTARAVSTEASTRIGHRTLQPRAIRTRDGIVEAAATQFNSFGYSASKTGDILAQAGSTKGAMYFHFSSKKSLAQHLVQLWCTVVVDTVTRPVVDESAQDRVAAIFRELARHVAADQVVRAGLLLSLERAVDENAKVYLAWTSAVTVIVEQASRGHLDAAAAPERLGESLCAGFVGAVHVASSLGEPETIERRVDDLLMLWLT